MIREYGNWHSVANADPENNPCGRVLLAYDGRNGGLIGYDGIYSLARFVGIGQTKARITFMTSELWNTLCSYENLELAYKKARKHKTLKTYVLEFEKNLKANLLQLQTELLLHCYI